MEYISFHENFSWFELSDDDISHNLDNVTRSWLLLLWHCSSEERPKSHDALFVVLCNRFTSSTKILVHKLIKVSKCKNLSSLSQFYFIYQWYLIGFTLCLSNTGGKLIGNLDHLLMREIGDRPSFTHDQVPLLLVSVWYCLFAAITPTVFLGAIAERARFLPTIIFIFLWTTLVFDFLCYWTWNKNGWSFQLGCINKPS